MAKPALLDALALSQRLSGAIDDAGLHPLRDGAPPVALAGYREPSAIFLIGTRTVLTDGGGAARRLRDSPNSGVAVEERLAPQFLEAAAALGVRPREIAVIDGLNYSNGDRVRIHLFASDIQ